MKEINPYFLAGCLDCDGSFQLQISVRKSTSGKKNIRINPRVVIAFKDGEKQRAVLEAITKEVGGKIYISNKDKGNAKVSWMTTNVDDCISVTEYVLPHLWQKDRTAERFLGVCEIIRDGKARRKGVNMYGGEKIYNKEQMIRMATVATSLNDSMQTARFRNTLGRDLGYYLKIIEEIYDS